MQPWRRLADVLSPLIGESGFCALYDRAARLASQRFGWMAPAPTGKSIDTALAGLRLAYAAQGPAEAMLANADLLATFTKLLTGLIGKPLTMQLLAAVPAGEGAMPVQEQKQ